MDGTGVRGILSIYDDMDSVVGMVQVSTKLTTRRKTMDLWVILSTVVIFTAVLIFL